MPSLPCSPLPSNLMFLSLFALSTNISICLPPSQPRLLHRSSLPFRCFHLHGVPQHWKCCSWRNLKQLAEEQQLAPPPSLLLIYSQIPPEPKKRWRPREGDGRSRSDVPTKVSRLGEEKGSGAPGAFRKAGPLAGGGRDHLRKWWLAQGCPGHRELFSCARPEEDPGWAQSPTRSWCNTLLDSKTCFLQLFLNLLVQDFLRLQGSSSLLLCSPASWGAHTNCEKYQNSHCHPRSSATSS